MTTLISPSVARLILVYLLALGAVRGLAQDRLKGMLGYQRYERMSRERTNAVKFGTVSVIWKDEGKVFEYQKEGKRYRYDIDSGTSTILTNTSAKAATDRTNNRPVRASAPARGRQHTSALSPDGRYKAIYRDRNLWLSETNGTNEIAVTRDGSEKPRIKYGTANWVYGEELYQSTAMWWSSNSQKIGFYRFDESRVPDFYLQLDQTKLMSKMDIEPYMKAGGTNPVVDIWIYDVQSSNTVHVDVRDGKPFDDDVLGHYIYGVSWSQDSKELLFHRTNRRQNIMEFCAADADTGKCRVIIREEWLPSWVANSPRMRFLKDGKRFISASERSGWNNLYLYDLSGELLATLTDHRFEVDSVVHVNEDARLVYYMARSGDNPLKLQLHCVRLDGTRDQRLTNPAYHHTVDMAPDGMHFIDVAQTHDIPPVTRLMNAQGNPVAELAWSDLTKFKRLEMRPVELITFKAADRETDLHGLLHFPSRFNPSKKYPLLVSVYAGPDSEGVRETFAMPSGLTEYGFLVASFDSRSVTGHGKYLLDSVYLKLGQAEIDDQAAGVKSLWDRRYVDRKRVGIYGTSYGGTASALCLMRYPDVFRAACASSPVTDFRNYDTIYTERYMWLPQENKEGYDDAALMSHIKDLKGRLMLYYGTADNNVHPNNAMQLIRALQRAGKSFE